MLSDDPDAEIAAQANATIEGLPREALSTFLASSISAELCAFSRLAAVNRTGRLRPAPPQAVKRCRPGLDPGG